MKSSAAQAFIAVLRCEAHQAEERAKALRTTAAAIEANNHEGGRKRKRLTDVSATRNGTNSSNPNTAAPDAKTLFVRVNLPNTKREYPELSQQEVASILERQWEAIPEEEKQLWVYKNGVIPEMDDGEDDEATSDEEESYDEATGAGKQPSNRRNSSELAAAAKEEF